MSFKDNIIKTVKGIPKGKVTTYGTVAVLSGLPRGARMVGGVLHSYIEENEIPWHRVINRIGYISTNCLEHPKALQRKLLQDEGIEVNDDFMVNLEKYGWWGDSKNTLDYS